MILLSLRAWARTKLLLYRITSSSIARAHPPGNFFLSMSRPWLSMSWCGTDPSGVSLSISCGSRSARDFDISCSPRLSFDASSLILSLPRTSLI